MLSVKDLLVPLKRARMHGDPRGGVEDFDRRRQHPHAHPRAGRKRRRVVVRARPDTALLIHHSETLFRQLEAFCGQRQQCRAFELLPGPDRHLALTGAPPFVRLTRAQQVSVQLALPIKCRLPINWEVCL